MGSLTKYTLLLLLAVFITACREPIEEHFVTLKQESFSFEDSLFVNQRIAGNAASGTFFARTNSKAQFGPGTVFSFPDSLVRKNIRVYVEGDFRKEKEGVGQCMVVSLNTAGKAYCWRLLDMDELVHANNKWVHISDSTEIPNYVNNLPGSDIRVFGFNTNPYSYMDYDNLKVTYKTVEYLPKKK